MKRRAALTAIILILAVIFAQAAFANDVLLIAPAPAGRLEVVSTVPENGETGKQITNMAVKIVFSEDVSDETNDASNAKCISIKDPEGNGQPFTIVHHPKSPNELWCILEENLVGDTEYTVTVAAGVRSSSGETLPSPYTFTFKTRNTKVDSIISILLTFGMMGIMLFATKRATSKQQDEKTAKGKGASALEKQTQTDPYRLAKEKGISVEEAKAEIAREKEKIDKKNASGVRAREKYEAEKAAKEAEIERRLQEIHDESVFKVKRRGSLVEHGGTVPKAVLKKQAKRRKAKKR